MAGQRVVVTGATGQIGRRLCDQLSARGYQVVVFSRNPDKARRSLPSAAEYVAWKAEEHGAWASAINGAHAVINLAGANLFGRRWTDAYKREIYDSRIVGTRGLVNAINAASDKPAVLINGSAIGYYGAHLDDRTFDESSGPGDDFLGRVCADWEREAERAAQSGVRVVLVRTGVVLSKPEKLLPIDLRGASLSRPGVVLDVDAGALPLMVFPFRLFAGGPMASGRQWFSWIHMDDEIGLIVKALEDHSITGPINATAPDPRTNREFSRVIGKVLNRPMWLPVPGFALKLLLGSMADAMLIKGQRVLPTKAQQHGYQFAYADTEHALRDLLRR